MYSYVLIFAVFIKISNCYNYENDGPDKWPIEFNTCAGKVQSPIDIQDWESKYNESLTPFNFIN